MVFGLFTTDEKRNKGGMILRLECKLRGALSDFLQQEESGGNSTPFGLVVGLGNRKTSLVPVLIVGCAFMPFEILPCFCATV